MTDKNDFDFEEESEETGLEKDEGHFDFDEPLPEDGTEMAEKKKSSNPLLLLLLLLVAIGAGAYYYFFMLPPSAPPVTAKVAKKQPIAVPARTAEPQAKPAQASKETSENGAAGQAADASKVAAADTGKAQVEAEVNKPAVAEEAAPAKEAAAKPVAETKAGAAAPADKEAAPEPKAVETAKTAPVAKEEAAEDAGAVSLVAVSAADARYTIQAGAYARTASLERAKKMVQELGYEPQVTAVQRQVEMIRLRLGAFYPDEGQEKLQEILPLAPDAFAVRKGNLMVIYAASFQDTKLAERFAASLKEKGLHVDEERSPVDLKMMLISFGAFSDKAKAEEAAKAAQKAGLETLVTALAR